MKYCINLLIVLGFISCNFESSKNAKPKEFEIQANQELRKGTYWYFDKIQSTDKNLLIIDNGEELIHLEIDSSLAFDLNFNDSISEGYIVDKDGKGFTISSGLLKGIIKDNNLILSGEITGKNNDTSSIEKGVYKLTFNTEQFISPVKN